MRAIVEAMLKAGTGQVAVLACTAFSMKILAVIGGPAGVGLFSLVRQVQQTLSMIALVGGQNAIVQGVASTSGARRANFIATSWILVAIASTIVCIVMLFLATPIAELLLPNLLQGAALLRWTAVAAALGAFLVVARSLLNAHMAIGTVANVNVVTAFAALLLTYPAAMAYREGWDVALIGILTGSLGTGLIFALRWSSRERAHLRGARVSLRGLAVREYLAVGMPSLLSGAVGMGAVLAVRAVVVRDFGLPAAGYFDAAWNVSLTLVLVFLTPVQTYLLPALSDKADEAAWRGVLLRTLRLVLLLAVPIIVGMITLKVFILRLLYSEEFLPALELLRWTLAGDYVRVAGWVLATALVARADMRSYLVAEIGWNIVFMAATLGFLKQGIEDVGPAYLGAYFTYLVLLVFLLHQRHAMVLDRRTVIAWLAGAGTIAATSVFAWSTELAPWQGAACLTAAVACSVLCMTANERRAAASALLRVARIRR